MENTPPTREIDAIQQERDKLVRQGARLREGLLCLLPEIQEFKVGLRHSFVRKDLKRLDDAFHAKFIEFISHDERVSNVLLDIATRNQIWPGNQPPPAHYVLLYHLYSSQLQSDRDSLRVMLEHIGSNLGTHRAHANNLVAVTIAVLSLAVAFLGLSFSLFQHFSR